VICFLIGVAVLLIFGVIEALTPSSHHQECLMTVRREYRINGQHNFVIDAVPQPNGTYEIYARLHPPDRHHRGAEHNHLLSGGRICVANGRKPTTAAQAIQIGRCWAEGWSQYVTDGHFPQQ